LEKKSIISVGLLVLAISLACVHFYRSVSSNGQTISIGVEFNTHATPVWIALKTNMFKAYGIHVSRMLKFRTGLELAAALARGNVKAGWACLGPILLIIDKGIPVKIIAKYHNYGYELVVNPSKIRSLKDLKDTPVYTPGKGSPASLLLLKIEEKYGIKFEAIRFMKPQNILAALLSGEINAACLP